MKTAAELVPPAVASLGLAHPPQGYTQEELLRRFKVEDRKIRSIFKSSHINIRYLVLPEPPPSGDIVDESSLELASNQ